MILTIRAVKKEIESKIKCCRQSWSEYFENFWCLIKFSFDHKWNQAWLIIRVERVSQKSQNFIELYPSTQSSSQNKNFVNTSKKLLKNVN